MAVADEGGVAVAGEGGVAVAGRRIDGAHTSYVTMLKHHCIHIARIQNNNILNQVRLVPPNNLGPPQPPFRCRARWPQGKCPCSVPVPDQDPDPDPDPALTPAALLLPLPDLTPAWPNPCLA